MQDAAWNGAWRGQCSSEECLRCRCYLGALQLCDGVEARGWLDPDRARRARQMRLQTPLSATAGACVCRKWLGTLSGFGPII